MRDGVPGRFSLVWQVDLAQAPHYPETRASPGGCFHRTSSGRHAHAPGSLTASCCFCNGSVGLNLQTARHVSDTYAEVWELKLWFCPSARGLKRKNKTKNIRELSLVWWCGGHSEVGRYLGSTRNGLVADLG